MPDVNKVARTRVWTGTAWQDTSEDARFVQNDGDTMTGALTIALATPAGALLPVSATIAATEFRCGPVGRSDILGIGNGALMAATNSATSAGNTAFGNRALELSTAGKNTAIGASALAKLTTGSGSTALGRGAGVWATTQNSSTYIGEDAGGDTSGSDAAAILGNENTFVGSQAGSQTTGAAVVAHGTVGIGVESAPTANYVVAIGRFATAAAANTIAIGGGTSTAVAASTSTAKTVQLLGPALTGVKVRNGADRLISLTELKAAVASSASWAAFQTTIAALVV